MRCPAEMMKTYGLCRIDVVGLPFDRFVLLLWQLRNFITDTRRNSILVCKESEKFLKGLPLERDLIMIQFPPPSWAKWIQMVFVKSRDHNVPHNHEYFS